MFPNTQDQYQCKPNELLSVDENRKWYCRSGEPFSSFLHKIQEELPVYDLQALS